MTAMTMITRTSKDSLRLMKRNPDNANQPVLPLDAPRPTPAPITAGQFLANKDRLFRWCLAGLFLSGVVNVLLLVLVLQLVAQPPWFFALDSAVDRARNNQGRQS